MNVTGVAFALHGPVAGLRNRGCDPCEDHPGGGLGIQGIGLALATAGGPIRPVRAAGIPFIAAWGPVPGSASGAHTHVGPPPPRVIGRH